MLAASADGDQQATFEVGSKKIELNIQNWGGFIGQWDDRQWTSKDTSHDDYGQMTGIRPGYIKRADLAWYASHHHNASGDNIPYAYSYLFAYRIDLAAGTKTMRLPDNDRIRILAVSVANENAAVKPVQPLYDVLPSPAAGPVNFALSASSSSISIPQGRSGTASISVLPRSGFKDSVTLMASGLPEGVTAKFSPASTGGTSKMTLTATNSTMPATSTVTITGVSGSLSHTATIGLSVTAVQPGTVAVDLSSVFNTTGIYADGSKFPATASLDGDGYACSEQVLGATQVGDGIEFKVGPANVPDVVTGKTVALPNEKFGSLKILAVGVNGSQELQTFTVTYVDGTSSSFTQSLSDWNAPRSFDGESVAVSMPYRLTSDGSNDDRAFNLYAYSFHLESSKAVRSISLPSNRYVLVFAMTLVPSSGGTTR
jgi:alpha-mannosidase